MIKAERKNGWIIIILLIICCVVCWCLVQSKVVLVVSPGTLKNDMTGQTGKLQLVKTHFCQKTVVPVSEYLLNREEIEQYLNLQIEGDAYILSPKGREGIVNIKAVYGSETINAKFYIVNSIQDSDRDNMPDAVELETEEDRQAFRNWFAAIAESQYMQKSNDFYAKNQDCAGLLRYAYVEALKPHDAAWLKYHNIRSRLIAGDVKKYAYPKVPVLGENIFLQGGTGPKFGPFADARTLLEQNCQFIGYDPEKLQNGDLLFYQREGEEYGEIWHSMIYLSPEQFDESYVVYHTGPRGTDIPDGSGEVRKVLFKELFNHPDVSWHPLKSNQYFKGFYRWKIIE